MSEPASGRPGMGPSKRALLLLRRMKSRLGELESVAREPIAIVGMACRFPGNATDLESLWRMLQGREDAISELPEGRALCEPKVGRDGIASSYPGGFLKEVAGFDRSFFGIGRHDACRMDPQHRLTLEVAWEALEDAGIPPDRLAGSTTGVFIGVSTADYCIAQSRAEVHAPDPALLLGSFHGAMPGRIAYLLDLRGPAVSIDTACSSALVAVHQACDALRRREVSLAIVGAVNALVLLDPTLGFESGGFVSARGVCRPFDAEADGFVRSEGCGVVVLKRLARAIADGDRIRAVIRGSATNQNGRSAGLMAPNGPAQEAVIRQALMNADVKATDIAYVEAHGTGTAIGDAIELEALNAVLGRPNEEGSRCLVGSVKANLGHLEAASGIAALIKTALVLERGEIPPQAHFERLNPAVSLEGSRLSVGIDGGTWPSGTVRRLAGVHSFSISGTNAHLVLEEPPRGPGRKVVPSSSAAQPIYVLPISAKTESALRRLAERYAGWLQRTSPSGPALHDLCYAASVRRTHHPQRLAIVGRSWSELASQLLLYVGGEMREAVHSGRAPLGANPPCAFVFPDSTSTSGGATRAFFREAAETRAIMDRCGAVLQKFVPWSLDEAIASDGEVGTRQGREMAGVSIFAVEVALATLWRRWGVAPDALFGEKVGKVAAAHVEGSKSLEDAIREVIEHSGGDSWEDAADDSVSRLAVFLERARTGAVVLEIGPGAAPSSSRAAALVIPRANVRVVHSCSPVKHPRAALCDAVGALYAAGAPIRWSELFPDGGRYVDLPLYAWSHEHCWYSELGVDGAVGQGVEEQNA